MRQQADYGGRWRCQYKSLPRAVRELIHAGWHVEAEGKAFRQPGRHARGSALGHRLVRAARRGGLRRRPRPACPRCWRRCAAAKPWCGWTTAPSACCRKSGCSASRRWRAWATKDEDHLRFRRNQAGLLDALLAAQPEVQRATRSSRACANALRGFQGVKAARAARGLRGPTCATTSARAWAGWISCGEFGFGGCLADDMGVGKTAQVLALLESRRARGPKRAVAGGGAEVAGVQLEAGSGALHAAAARARPHRHWRATWRLIAAARPGPHHLRHAAPRRAAASQDRVRLRGAGRSPGHQERRHRIGQGRAPAARRASPGAQRHAGGEPPGRVVEPVRVPQSRHAGRGQRAQAGRRRWRAIPSEETRQLLAQALRPFILRRTKEQVARELPAKTEQTIYCELEAAAAQALRRTARALPRRRCSSAVETRGPGRVEDAGAGSAAAPAPGGLPPGPARPETRGRAQRQAGRAAGAACRGARGRPQGAGVLAVHQPAGDRARSAWTRPACATSTWTARRATGRRTWSVSRTTRTAGCS